jgi:hypothetical protein
MARGVRFLSTQASGAEPPENAYWYWQGTDWWNPDTESLTVTYWCRFDGATPSGSDATYGQCGCKVTDWAAGAPDPTPVNGIEDVSNDTGPSSVALWQHSNILTINSSYTAFQNHHNFDTGDVVYICWTWDTADDTRRVYTALDADTSLTTGPTSTKTPGGSASDAFVLGWNGWSTEGANISVTNVKVWKTALDTTQLLAEKTSEDPIVGSVYLHYKITSGTDLDDSSGSSRDLTQVLTGASSTITNSTMVVNSLEPAAAGPIAGSLALTGVGI